MSAIIAAWPAWIVLAIMVVGCAVAATYDPGHGNDQEDR